MLYQVSLIRHGRFGAKVRHRFVVLASSLAEARELIAPMSLDGEEVEAKPIGEQIAEVFSDQNIPSLKAVC